MDMAQHGHEAHTLALGSYASHIGEMAWHQIPGSMTVNASRCDVSAATMVGPIMHTHMLIEWMR